MALSQWSEILSSLISAVTLILVALIGLAANHEMYENMICYYYGYNSYYTKLIEERFGKSFMYFKTKFPFLPFGNKAYFVYDCYDNIILVCNSIDNLKKCLELYYCGNNNVMVSSKFLKNLPDEVICVIWSTKAVCQVQVKSEPSYLNHDSVESSSYALLTEDNIYIGSITFQYHQFIYNTKFCWFFEVLLPFLTDKIKDRGDMTLQLRGILYMILSKADYDDVHNTGSITFQNYWKLLRVICQTYLVSIHLWEEVDPGIENNRLLINWFNPPTENGGEDKRLQLTLIRPTWDHPTWSVKVWKFTGCSFVGGFVNPRDLIGG